MTQEQMKAALDEIKELIKDSGWAIDDHDAMDGFVYITICKPQNENE